jgi:acetyltransferase
MATVPRSLQDEEYPAELNDSFTLPDNTRVRVRALHRFEDAPIRQLFEHLSPRSRYLRFLSGFEVLPDSIVATLTGVDHRRHVELVAERDTADGVEVIGLGSFGAIDDRHVEVALVIRDDWQRQRIGTELAIRVLDAAEARGFHRFVAHILAENRPIRRLLNNVGDVTSATASGSTVELVFIRHHVT